MFPPDPFVAAVKEAKAMRAMKAAAFAADPTGYALEEMSKNSTIVVMPILGPTIERTGPAPVRKDNTDVKTSEPKPRVMPGQRALNVDTTEEFQWTPVAELERLRSELAAAKQALDDARKLLVIPSYLDANEATTRILDTIREDRQIIATLHKEVREAKQALTEKDSTIAALRAVLPAKVSITVSGNATISAKAERTAYQQPAPSDIANDRDDALRDTLRSLGMSGSFARNVALTALSVGPVDVEDHRVTNAVRAREEEILTYLRKEYASYAKFAEPPKTWFRRFFGPHEWEVRGDSFCRALLHVYRFIRKDSPNSVLDNMRFNP